MTRTAVLAIGGNALTSEGQRGTYDEQYANALRMAGVVHSMLQLGWRVVMVHGNGPQIGNLAIQQEEGASLVPSQPLHALGAMTQGAMGSLLCLAVREVCGDDITGVAAIVTHVVVDSTDPAFLNPTKPIGPFFDAKQARSLERERGWTLTADAGRGYRRVVVSPEPVAIVETDALVALLEAGLVVVTAGGGGVPVRRQGDHGLRGVEAVIDKDLAAARIAASMGADALVVLTAVPAVKLDFGLPTERDITEMSAMEARHHLRDRQFPAGSMGPKVAAAIQFLEAGGSVAAITTPELAAATLAPSGGTAPRGTRIVPDTDHPPATGPGAQITTVMGSAANGA